MTKRKPAKITERQKLLIINEQLNIMLSIAERKVKRLKAENDRLVKQHNSIVDMKLDAFVTAVPSADYEQLKAENERLRKAGDALAEATFEIPMKTKDSVRLDFAILDWKAAKQPPTDPTK